ncbi:hypothetical protein [Nocardia higoensis]|uniref:hypothetical protein n=1 Tax=Nocardia higoensis TaxID=228599 RepID=UPI000592FF65|nr:hypothetical protein [Nocardia higoensis]
MSVDRVAAVRDLFPADTVESGDDAAMVAAGQAIAYLWQYLAQGTAGTRSVLDDPAAAGHLFAALAKAGETSVDVLGRLSFYAVNLGDQSTYSTRFAHRAPDGTWDLVQSTAHLAAGRLRIATEAHGLASHQLGVAADLFSFLYVVA